MTVMVKRWYRSRRNQIIIFIALMLSIAYYLSLNDSLERVPDLDITRRTSPPVVSFTKPTTLHAPVKVTSLTKQILEPDVRNSYNSEYKVVIVSDGRIVNSKAYKQAEIYWYIEHKLQEALKQDKGTGCEIPQLDPFAKEIMQFDKIMPKVVCKDIDWVRCYQSSCKVLQNILDTTSDIECEYQDIIYQSDYKYVVAPPVKVEGSGVYTLTRSDHVKIKCTGKREKSLVKTSWIGYSVGFRTSVERVAPPPGRENTLNVLIFGFDSTSKNGFIRKMPKSYKCLTQELEGTVLNGYNIVGDGTPAALFPILTGKNELELPDVRKKMRNNGTLDQMPFVFYTLKQDGYRTAYFEDMPWIGTFQYRFNGFKRQPVDHYLRSFYLEESSGGKKWWNNKGRRYCVGGTPQYKLMMNITDQFMNLDGKRFCFTFIADITHDDFNMISTADEDFVDFLRSFKAQGRLKDTLLMVMGDHGPRYANVRDTLQGKLEERLPLMAIILPEVLKRQRPRAQAALEANTGALTTPHDIHATLLDALDMTQHGNPYRVRGADLPRGMSLLEPIPRNRSCSEAGVEPHWCACVSWRAVPATDRMYQRTADAFINYINSLTDPVRSACVPRTLLSVSWVQRQHANSRMLSFGGAKDADGYIGKFDSAVDIARKMVVLSLKVVVGPGRGVYEASMTYRKKEDQFDINTRDISRINAYGEEPSCISATHPHLNMYCYCKDYVSNGY